MTNPKLPVPDNLTRDQQKSLLAWIKNKAHPPTGVPDLFFVKLTKNFKLIRHHVDNCLQWHRDNEVKRRDFVAACRNWITKEAIIAEEREAERRIEKPQMQGRRGKEFSPLADTLEMFETNRPKDEN